MKRKKVFSLVGFGLLGVACLFLVGCSGRQVTIGVAAPLTGEQADGGKAVLHGAQLAVDDWNAKGGVLGKKIVLVSEDDKGDPDQALLVARKFMDDVDVVIGHYNSNCTLAAEPLYDKRKVLVITPSSTNPEVTDKGYLTVFRVCGRDDQQGKSAAEFVADHFKDARVAIVHDNSAYGHDLVDEFLKNYEFKTAKKSVFHGSIQRSCVDIPDTVAKLIKAKPTIVYFGGLWPQGARVLKELRKEGSKATFISGDGCFDPSFLKEAGSDAEGVLVTFVPNPKKLEGAKDILTRYQARFGEPRPYSLYAYAAVQVALEGIKKAGTKDGVAVSRVLRQMEIDTPLGELKFDQNGDPNESPYVMWQVKNGKYVEMPTVDKAEGKKSPLSK